MPPGKQTRTRDASLPVTEPLRVDGTSVRNNRINVMDPNGWVGARSRQGDSHKAYMRKKPTLKS
ncbi:hypothetical protein E4U43_005168 [Claviceps pusilla]|uniref:Uncharacterized protein n=1 Tax=Claviceps pusilla TaxID=123648 RepID=A0A9P7N4U0_9HYPO|nr:hypothetical protein E4U43_005168 [Claviceps pusilla]